MGRLRRVVLGLVCIVVAPLLCTVAPGPVHARPAEPRVPAVAGAPSASASCAPLDLVLVLDTTSSMDPAIDNVIAQVDAFVSRAEEVSGGDYRLGLIDFGRDVEVHVPLAARNAQAIRDALPTLDQRSNNDGFPEAWDEALATAVDDRSAADVPDGGQIGDFTEPWRPDAQKLIMLVSDARPAGFDDDWDPADSDHAFAVAGRAQRAGIRIASYFVPNGNDEGNQEYRAVGGGPGDHGAGYYLKQVADLTGAPFAATAADGSNLGEGLDFATSTCAADTDGDGLSDTWETEGIDADDDGTIDLDLAAMGADPKRKDVFVQVNWMVFDEARPCAFLIWFCGESEGEDSPPRQAALQRVIEAYAAAPVENPDGTEGITLHIDAGPLTPPNGGIPKGQRTGGGMFDAVGSVEDLEGYDSLEGPGFQKAIAALRRKSMDQARSQAFTWSLYAYRIDRDPSDGTILGSALGLPSDAFVMSGSSFTSANDEAGTFMHELGHTLGLAHGGTNHANYKPNYLSIMNYGFLHRGGVIVDGRRRLDYSRWDLVSLDEDALDETAGVAGAGGTTPEGLQSQLFCGGVWPSKSGFADKKQYQQFDLGDPVDWDCDGSVDASPVSALVHDAAPNHGYPDAMVLETQDDWSSLTFTGGERGGFASAPASFEPDDDLTEEQWKEMPKPQAIAVTGPNKVAVPAGAPAMASLDLENFGTEDDAYDVEVAAAPDGDWTPVDLEAFGAGDVASGDHATIGADFTVPDDAKGSAFITVTVTSRADETVSSDERIELVVDGAAADIPVTTGALDVPKRLAPGAKGKVSGTGFAPGAAVLLRFADDARPARVVIADDDGSIEAEVTAPDATGELAITAEGRDGGDDAKGRRLTGTVQVKEAIGPAKSESDGSAPWPLLGVLGAAVLGLIIIAVVLVRRRRRPLDPGDGPVPSPGPAPAPPGPAASAAPTVPEVRPTGPGEPPIGPSPVIPPRRPAPRPATGGLRSTVAPKPEPGLDAPAPRAPARRAPAPPAPPPSPSKPPVRPPAHPAEESKLRSSLKPRKRPPPHGPAEG